jgi:Ca2+-binding RTX toxin-like protein
LSGGQGNDYLYGEGGDDTYLFNVGNGIDYIGDYEGDTTIIFGEGIVPGDLSLGLGSLLIHVGDGGDAIHLDNFYSEQVHLYIPLSEN